MVLLIFTRTEKKLEMAIGGDAGDMLAKYLRRATYVNVALECWSHKSVRVILNSIKSDLGDNEYSKIIPEFTKEYKVLESEIRAESNAILDGTKNILNDVGSVTDNFQNIDGSFERIINRRMKLLWMLRSLLNSSKADETLQGYVSDIIESVGEFLKEQFRVYVRTIEELEAASSQ
ncbi:hypothetical protein BASA61_008174 [Batrachochytrium salamandrivorans]|nr:hypothetical protein BASA61_008174 [Batrachochytrium salamandrivorans]